MWHKGPQLPLRLLGWSGPQPTGVHAVLPETLSSRALQVASPPAVNVSAEVVFPTNVKREALQKPVSPCCLTVCGPPATMQPRRLPVMRNSIRFVWVFPLFTGPSQVSDPRELHTSVVPQQAFAWETWSLEKYCCTVYGCLRSLESEKVKGCQMLVKRNCLVDKDMPPRKISCLSFRWWTLRMWN